MSIGHFRIKVAYFPCQIVSSTPLECTICLCLPRTARKLAGLSEHNKRFGNRIGRTYHIFSEEQIDAAVLEKPRAEYEREYESRMAEVFALPAYRGGVYREEEGLCQRCWKQIRDADMGVYVLAAAIGGLAIAVIMQRLGLNPF